MNLTDDILLAGQIAAAISAIGALLYAIVIYAVVKPIKAYIDHATYQIQPHANGGKSLPDIAEMVQHIDAQLDGMEKRIFTIEKQIRKTMKAEDKTA